MPLTAKREAQLQALAVAAMEVARASSLTAAAERIRMGLLAATASLHAYVKLDDTVAGALPEGIGSTGAALLQTRAAATDRPIRFSATEFTDQPTTGAAGADRPMMAVVPRHPDGTELGLLVVARRTGEYDAADEAALVQMSALAVLTADAIASRAAELRKEEEVAVSMKAAGLGRWTIDLVTGERHWDSRLLEMLELDPHQQTREATRAAVHPDDLPAVDAAIAAAMDPSGNGEVDVSYRTIGPKTGIQRTIRAIGRASFVNGRCERLSGVVEDISRWVAAETERRYREQAFRLAVEAADLGMWDLELATMRLHWSSRCRTIFGIGLTEPVTLDDFYAFIHDGDRETVRSAFTACLDPAVRADYVAEFRIVWRDGTIRWLDARGRGVFADDGRCERAIGTVIDITERKAVEVQTRLVAQEMHHRVKNSIAMAQAVARQTFRNAPDLASAETTLIARFGALASVQDVLVGREAPTGRLSEIIARGVVALAPAGRVDVTGPEVTLDRKRSIAVALAFHELVTNATKYGALSNAVGRIAVSWETEERAARLCWRESGGPTVSRPERRGFGTRLIERMLSDELDGGVEVDWNPAGLVVSLIVPRAP